MSQLRAARWQTPDRRWRPSGEFTPDRERLISYRYARFQRQILDNDCAAAVLSNPLHVRYATDTHYAQITNMHSPFRYVFVP